MFAWPRLIIANTVLLTLLLLAFTGCAATDREGEASTYANEQKKEMEARQASIEGAEPVAAAVIATEKKLPAEFDERAFRREWPIAGPYLAARAADEAQYDQLWRQYRLTMDRPTVHFENQQVLFIGLQEPSSCHLELDFLLSADGKALVAQTDFDDSISSDCTADATPRTFVVTADRAVLEHVDHVIMVEGGGSERTAVPFAEWY